MDSEKPGKASNLLSDLESIRQLLEQSPQEPPLLTERFDPSSIPLLSDIVDPAQLTAPRFNRPTPNRTPLAELVSVASTAPQPSAIAITAAPAVTPIATQTAAAATSTQAQPISRAALSQTLPRNLHPNALELNRLDRELHSAAQLMLQDVIDDFVPQIEAELKRRLDLQLTLLLNQRKP